VRIFLTLAVLTLATLACALPEFPPVEPTPTPTPTPVPTATRRAAPSATSTSESVDTLTIQAVVYIRAEADANSAAIGSLQTGERVGIVACDGDWCELERGGWVWRGCTDDNPDELLCEARP
jgi:hypothetical protein